MKRIDSQNKSSLWLPDEPEILHRWQTIGMLVSPQVENPAILNFFKVYISANTKAKVRRFVEYQEAQGSKGQKSIQVVVEKLQSKPTEYIDVSTPPIPTLEHALSMFEKGQKEKNFLLRLGDINIGIDRVFMGTSKPYKITYTIDPTFVTIGVGKKWFSVGLSADHPFVSCRSDKGKINLMLWESLPWGGREDRARRDISAGGITTITDVTKKYTGKWSVEVTGKELDNAFTLDFTKYYF